MSLSCLLGTGPEETDFTWPRLSSGKRSSFSVFIFGFPSVLLGLQLIPSFWVASWAAGTKSLSKQFAWSFAGDLGFTRGWKGLNLGQVHAPLLMERRYLWLLPAWGRGGEARQKDREFALPRERWQPACRCWEPARREGTGCKSLRG